MDQFEKVKTRLLLENRHFSESDFVVSFINGLKEDVKPFVKPFKPLTLEDAYEYALHMENAIDCQFKKLKITVKSNVSSSLSAPKFGHE